MRHTAQVILHWYEGQDKVDLSDYVNSGTWNIMSCPGVYTYKYDKAEGYHKAQITFTLQLRRKTLFYTVNLIIPCVLISFRACSSHSVRAHLIPCVLISFRASSSHPVRAHLIPCVLISFRASSSHSSASASSICPPMPARR